MGRQKIRYVEFQFQEGTIERVVLVLQALL